MGKYNYHYHKEPIITYVSGTNINSTVYNANSAIFGYEYRYDDRGNVVKKFLPQCGYIQYWYDNDNRLIYMQDGRMREKGLYRFYLYDKLSRVVVEGTCTSCNRGKNVTRTTLDTRQSGFLGTGYVIGHDLRLENPKLEVVNYYDNYDYLSLPLAKTNHGLDWQQQITSGTNTTGLVTGTYSVASDNSPLLDVFCYNAKGQVIQSYRVLSDKSFLWQKTKYTFTGKPEKASLVLFKNGRGYTTETNNTYNKHNDQFESATLSVNGTQRRISALDYDDLGRIKSSSLGQTSTEYTYNLRGWTTDIVNPKFEEHLTYNDGSLGTPYFSGNISTQQWKTADDNILRGYKFTYDKLNRLTNSEYGEGTSLGTNQGRYSESIQGYTANGAITKILRNGLTQKGTYDAIDDLSITLNGNQLSSIEEKAAPVLRAGSFDFRKVSSPSDGQDEYMYDENGALIYDANRGITKIEYDLRNNPRLIQFSDGSQTEYVYSAMGEKMKTIHRTATPNSVACDGGDTIVGGDPTSNPFPMPRLLSSGTAMQNTDTATCQDMTATTILSIDSTEYIGSFIFENGHADKYLFPGGYYSYAVGHPSRTGGDGSGYYYYLTDHLGNNLVVVNDNGDIEQTTHYYPFGAVYGDAGKNPDFQKHKYTGKELDLTHGLNTYDHGARQNYSILGVWDRLDPLAEKYYSVSPYVVCNDNTVNYIDASGKDWIEDSLGNVSWSKEYTKENVPTGCKYLGEDYEGFRVNIYERAIDEQGRVGLKIAISHDIKDSNDYNWIQEVSLNYLDEFYFKGPYIDYKQNYPFYYDDNEISTHLNGTSLQFEDFPARDKHRDLVWRAELSNVEKYSNNYKLGKTISYGFWIKDGKVHLLPISIVPSIGISNYIVSTLDK